MIDDNRDIYIIGIGIEICVVGVLVMFFCLLQKFIGRMLVLFCCLFLVFFVVFFWELWVSGI